MKFVPPLGGMQQVGAAKPSVKSVICCVYFRLVITSG